MQEKTFRRKIFTVAKKKSIIKFLGIKFVRSVQKKNLTFENEEEYLFPLV